jgi:hypothetical protein
MNLRESMLAAAEQAPLDRSTVDIDRIVARERRNAYARRAGAGVAAVLAAALAVPVFAAEEGHPPAGPPAAVGPTSAPALRLTAADLAAALTGPDASDADFWRVGVGNLPQHAGLIMIRIGAGDPADPGANPCELAPGATPGRDWAPTPADRCTRVERDGRSAWIRRWGYSPTERPWSTPDTVIIDILTQLHGRPVWLLLGNVMPPSGSATAGPQGPRFEISDTELADFVFGIFLHKE